MTIVHRIEDGMDRRQVTATTYQMRNFYRQLRDGYFTSLDIFNYVQHHQAARLARRGDKLLDVCCGRGLLLPLLRFHAKELDSYTGVDIHPPNAVWQRERVTDGQPLPDGWYPWPTRFVEANVASMDQHLPAGEFTYLVYTASIEHMNPADGAASLRACRAVAAPGAQLLLTCPATPEDQDGYATAKRAHVYEWKRSELEPALTDAGWAITDRWGITATLTNIRRAAEPAGLSRTVDLLARHVPRDWLAPILAPLFPAAADEIAYLAVAQ